MKSGIFYLIFAVCLLVSGVTAYPLSPTDDRIGAAFDYLHTCQQDNGGFAETGRETDADTSWFVLMAIVAAGEDPNDWVAGGASAVDYWSSPENPWTVPDGTAELAKTVLAIRALDGDPRSWNGTDYLGALQSRMKPDGHFGDHIYTHYWSMLALVASGEDARKPTEWLKQQQNPDGGFPWTLYEGTFIDSDADDTAASVMALLAAGEDPDSTVITKAKDYLRSQQLGDGGYSYGSGGSNSASDTWVAQAVVALGEDPSTWKGKNGSLVQDLLSYQKSDGSFMWTHLMTDNPCRMTAGAIPGLLGMPYPNLPGQTAPVFPSTGEEGEGTTVREPFIAGYPTAVTTVPPDDRVVTVVDDFGAKVTINGTPRRIISLAPSNTEILYDLGLDDRIVGVTDYCNYPPEAEKVDRVGGYSTPNLEKVIAKKPDLVVCSFGNTDEAIKRLRDLGLTVIATNPTDLSGVMDDVVMLGKATGTEDRADEIVADMQTRIEHVTDRTSAVDERPSAVHIVWYDPIWVSGSETYQDTLLELAGARNAFPEIKGWGIVNLEKFIITDPDVIIVNSGTGMGEEGVDIIYNWILDEPRLKNMTAVKNNRVYLIDSDIIDRPTPRLVDALEVLAVDIHPELFGNATVPRPTAHSTPVLWPVALGIAAVLIAARWRRRW
ncbi:MAG: hypothetical protein PWP08_759 [Methanofollis sp.]|nr:hypothetical protein [Methanofollis sp.]